MRKKGFTLIELLGIIIVIGLVFVIITPIVTKTIEETALVLAKSNADSYRKKINQFLIQRKINKQFSNIDGEYTINEDGSLSNEDNIYPISLTGKAPKTGYIRIVDDTVDSGCVQINQYAVTIENKLITTAKEGQCEMPEIEIAYEEFPQVKDTNPGIICGTGTEEDYDNSTECYIYSVEDLVGFSNLTNSGKTFQNKTVYLMNNLDIENVKSYVDINSNEFGDVNENGTVEDTLIEELTNTTSSSKGFKPISTAYKFKGVFQGNAHKINNLYINRTNINYVGLFGYNQGTIKGIKIEGMTVKGSSYVGLVAGYNNGGKITSTIAKGSISGYTYLGHVTGFNEGLGTIEAVTEGNITSSYNSGSNYACVGGIVGELYNGTVKGIMRDGKITVTSGKSYRTIGYNYGGTSSTISSSSVTATYLDAGFNNMSGTGLTQSKIDNIGTLERVLDTYIGGDNDSDGYYYDLDENGNITILSTQENPFTITMAGSGTSGDPYIITNYDQLKEAAYNVTKSYRLNADIDMSNQNTIMLSGVDHPFTGTFDGNGHTISNGTYKGQDYIGLFGYNKGTIRGLKLDNMNIDGGSYLGLVTGYNYGGSITSTIAKGSISGYTYLGHVTGFNDGLGTIEAVAEGNITSSYDSGSNYAFVGGIVGYLYNGTAKGIMRTGTITVTSGRSYRTIGYNNGGTSSTISSSSVTATYSDAGLNNVSGTGLAQSRIDNIGTLERVLDTYIGGDNNSDGYYYDLDEDGNITVYSTIDHPFTITMAGSGTSSDPYIITNYDQLKEAAYDTTKSYRLNTDIDMSNQNTIMLSGVDHPFTGTFDGNGHTISNGTYKGQDYIGLFGYNKGTIRGIKLDNINVYGNSYLGLVTGYNYGGTITSIIAKGSISGYTYLGHVTGFNEGNGTIEAVTEGNITSSYNSGSNYACVGGIVGELYNGTVKGIMRTGTITVTSGKSYRTIGYNYGGTSSTISSSTVTAPYSDGGLNNMSGTGLAQSYIDNIGALERVLDTYIGGDNDSDGYYYDLDVSGNITVVSTLDHPFTITMTGEGTTNAPYIITNYNQLKEAAYDTTKSYRLNTDIDMSNKNTIMLSGINNKFTGTFDGNGHTISNGTYKGQDYLGLFGYNKGTIRGLKLDNMNVYGSSYLGTVAGYNNGGSITSTIAKGIISGYTYLGHAAGTNEGNGTIEIVAEGNITSSYDSGSNYAFVGGIVGYLYNGTAKGIMRTGTITVTSGKGYRTIGYNNGGASSTISSSSVTAPYSDGGLNNASGTGLAQSYINNIGTLERVLDTYIGGDNDSDGYYYDLDVSGNITVVSTLDHPFTRTMTGEGTTNSPYIITNYDQLKEAAYDTTKSYRLNADIDMLNQNTIMLSSVDHPFTGTFDGNGHTISNGTYKGQDYLGLFGYNKGTIRGLKLDNMNVYGSSYLGTVAGYNNGGSITSTIAKGIISGYTYLGHAVGTNEGNGTIEIVAEGNITSSYDSGSNYACVGGIVGYLYNGTAKGIMRTGTITVTSGKSYRTIGYKYGGTSSTISSSAVTATYSDAGLNNMSGTGLAQSYINNIGTLERVLDTYIGGDNDSDGYYYDLDVSGNITVVSTLDHPFTRTMTGEGTTNSPYIITNYDQLKEAAYDTTKSYRLNADIDMLNQNTIMLSSVDHPFTGTFDGNGHTISNGTYKGQDYLGLFGYNRGTIKGLMLDNMNVYGSSYLGTVAGYNNGGSITSTIAKGSISGYTYLGHAVGTNEGNGTIEIVAEGNITSSYDSGSNYACVGGIVGYLYNGTAKGIMRTGTITVTSGKSYRTIGYNYSGGSTTGAANTVTAPYSDVGLNNLSGKTFTPAQLLTTAPYQEVGLNTSSTSGEYRYEFDTNNNLYIVKN